mmetsp:Transcript_16670/g.39115  ORF Transcript_16670/g.39115 Transcript_16670/m.39115 type:complete len:293 (+) Transcript_16670:193-1071(+)
MSGATRGRPKMRLVGKASMRNCSIRLGNSSASRIKTRRGAWSKLPTPAVPTAPPPAANAGAKFNAGGAAAAAGGRTPPARRRMASCSTGNCLSHHGQPWRVNMMTTCSWPWAMAVTRALASACLHSAVTAPPSVRLGSASRTNLPSLMSTSSPLCGTTSKASPALGLAAPSARTDSVGASAAWPAKKRCCTRDAPSPASNNSTRPPRTLEVSLWRCEYPTASTQANARPGSREKNAFKRLSTSTATKLAMRCCAASKRPGAGGAGTLARRLSQCSNAQAQSSNAPHVSNRCG